MFIILNKVLREFKISWKINILKKNPIGRPRKTRRQDDKANQ